MFFHAATTTFETPCSWVFTKEDGSSGSSFAKLLPLLPSSFVNTHEQGVSKVVVAA